MSIKNTIYDILSGLLLYILLSFIVFFATGKDMSDWLAPGFKPISPHEAYYNGKMHISP